MKCEEGRGLEGIGGALETPAPLANEVVLFPVLTVASEARFHPARWTAGLLVFTPWLSRPEDVVPNLQLVIAAEDHPEEDADQPAFVRSELGRF